jgi:hypothetical protein
VLDTAESQYEKMMEINLKRAFYRASDVTATSIFADGGIMDSSPGR